MSGDLEPNSMTNETLNSESEEQNLQVLPMQLSDQFIDFYDQLCFYLKAKLKKSEHFAIINLCQEIKRNIC